MKILYQAHLVYVGGHAYMPFTCTHTHTHTVVQLCICRWDAQFYSYLKQFIEHS